MIDIRPILKKAVLGGRLSLEEGTALYASNDLPALGEAADQMRMRFHRQRQVTYIIDRNINYTNVCVCECRFCAFWRPAPHPEAYVMEKDELFGKIEETIAANGTAIMLQGGLHPKLNLDYFLSLLKSVKERYKIHIHSFSPPEIVHLARISRLTPQAVLRALQNAGLDSLPGGGAEILVDRVREIISPSKISWEKWMEVMHLAHQMGMKTTATMMFGHVETYEERILHMIRVREQQDRTGGFTAFIPWTYQPQNTRLGGTAAGGTDYLKTIAISRLMLDNVPNIQVSWVTQGLKVAQIALAFGANDFGSLMLEENVVRAAGVSYQAQLSEIVHCIEEAGYIPRQRDTLYQLIKA